jgi:hypothetical protein
MSEQLGLFDGGEENPRLSDKEKKRLHEQLVRLGDMMGDGLHYEADGKWIEKEYQQVLYALYPDIKKRKTKNRIENINKRAKAMIMKERCSCGGFLKQTRSGSLTLECMVCDNRYKIKTKKS